MGAAVAVHDPADRPGWLEKLLVLGICAGLFVAVHVADQRGREGNEVKAREVLAERAQRSAERASREATGAPAGVARTDRLGGDDTPLVLPGGLSIGAATSVMESPPRRAAVTASGTGRGRDDAGAILLLLMAGAGLSMCGAGLRLLSRRSA